MKSGISPLLQLAADYNVAGSMWMECGEERCFGPGKMQLLQGIEKTGSISGAAKEMGMSYKKAWNMVQELNVHFTSTMVITQGGGEGGGGSTLTAAAKDLMHYYEAMRARFTTFLQQEIQLLNG